MLNLRLDTPNTFYIKQVKSVLFIFENVTHLLQQWDAVPVLHAAQLELSLKHQ